MNRLFACLVCVLVLLRMPVCVGAVGKVTADPNNSNTIRKATSAETEEKRMSQKVTLVLTHKPVKTVLAMLSASTGVTLRAGFTSDDWQVRDRKMTLIVKDVPLSEVMNRIAQAMKFKWSKNTDVDPPTYRLYMDRQSLLGNDSAGYRAQKKYDELCRQKREDCLAQIKDLEKMSDEDIEKLKKTNYYLYWLHQNGADKVINAMFGQIPGLTESFLNKDTNLDTSASVLSDDAQQALLHLVQERWKSSDRYHDNSLPFPADKIGPISEAELIMEFVPRPFDEWSQSSQHWGFGGVGIYLKDGFHKLAELGDPASPMNSLDSKERSGFSESGESFDVVKKKCDAEFDIALQQDKKALEAIFPTEPEIEHPDEPALHVTLKDVKPSSNKLADLLLALSDATGLSIVSDSFASVQGSVDFGKEIELKDALDKIAKAYRYTWEKEGNTVMLRSRDWFILRMSQLPDEWIEAWLKDIRDNEFLTIDSYAWISLLDSKQIAENVESQEELKAAQVAGWALTNNKNFLRFYSTLNASQRSTVFSTAGLCLRQLQPHQLEAARKAFRNSGYGKADLSSISDLLKDDASLDMTLRGKYVMSGKFKSACDVRLIGPDGSEQLRWYVDFPRYVKPKTAAETQAEVSIERLKGLIKSGKSKDAKELMDKILKDSPSMATYDSVSVVLCDNSMASEAIQMWESRIKQLDPAKVSPSEEADYYQRLAWASGSAHNVAKEEEARKHITEIGLKTKDARRVISVAWFYASKGMKLDESVKLCKQAIELAPEDLGFRSTLAMAQIKLGDYKTAIKDLEMCIDKLKASDNAAIRFQLGEAYAKSGDTTKAKSELEEARKLGYDPKEIDRVLTSIK